MTDNPTQSTRRSLIDRLDRLYPAVVADCLDKVGVRTNVMDPRIRPIYPSARMAGVASTVHAIEVDSPPDNPDDYYKGELRAVDALTDGDIMVVSQIRKSEAFLALRTLLEKSILIALVIITYVPELSLWLVNAMGIR